MSGLFVREEEEHEEVAPVTAATDEYQSTDGVEDPVIKEIPINLIKNPGLLLQILQYPGRPATRPFRKSKDTAVVSARQKQSVNLVEVEAPINTEKFFDEEKSEQWHNLQTQQLGGVFIPNDGYYCGSVRNGEINLVPVDKTVQMRPVFNYIDRETVEKKEASLAENGHGNLVKSNANNGGNVHVVQMTVKSSFDAAPRLAGALSVHKKAAEEEYTPINWKDIELPECESKREEIFNPEQMSKLNTTTTKEEYFDQLFKSTIV